MIGNGQRQKGLSSLSLLVILAAASFILLAAFRLGPLYIDNYFVKASVESLQNEDVREMSDRQIRSALSRYFTINGVRDIDARDAEIERSTEGVLVKLDYEKRVDFLANVDVVVIFENHFDSSQY